jgi:phenylalanyl-tRNA synthetase alpha chain
MENLKKIIKELEEKILTALRDAQTENDVENVRIQYLTRQGPVAQLMNRLKSMDVEQKKIFGPVLNDLRKKTTHAFDTRLLEVKEYDRLMKQKKKTLFDVTAYKSDQVKGSLHPYSILLQKIENVFISMGYAIVDSPEIETEFANFEALNIPADHPARDMQDTLWLDLPQRLMRTHTSNAQVHYMENHKPPFAILAPGRCYRYEATDATHDYTFMQTEGLFVGENISMGNLIATMKEFLGALFENSKITVRVRPGYFPFVEPGVEIDMQCIFCKKGCSICKGSRWIEVVGAGLVHPNVLKACKVNPEKYNGFAFGFGLTRLAMFKYGINDIRLLSNGNLDFLNQF